MKKVFKIFIALLFIGIITFLCYESYVLYTNQVDKDNAEKIEEEQLDFSPIFTLENYPKVDASLATQPLTNAFIETFTGEKNISEDYLDYTNTHPAYIRLVDKEADLIVVTEPSEDELKYAKDNDVELEIIPVVREGFVFYVNSENTVDNLTLEEIQKIYTGEITNWSEVGGNDEEIRPFQRPENSGSQTGMLSLVMKDLKLMEPIKENLADSMYDIINLVSSYDNGKNSIGYSYYYYAATMFDSIDKNIADGIKLLKVNDVLPSNETIKNMTYPLQTAYYIVIRKDEPENSDTRKLVEAMLSREGQAVAEEVGYVGVK